MSARTAAIGRAVLLLASAALIAKLLAIGEMVKYMAPALDPLTALTGFVFAVMGANGGVAGAPTSLRSPRATDAPNLHDIEHGHLHAVGTATPPRERWRPRSSAGSRGRSCCYRSPGIGRGAARAGHLRAGGRARDALAPDVCSPALLRRHRPPQSEEPLDDVGPLLAYLRTSRGVEVSDSPCA